MSKRRRATWRTRGSPSTATSSLVAEGCRRQAVARRRAGALRFRVQRVNALQKTLELVKLGPRKSRSTRARPGGAGQGRRSLRADQSRQHHHPRAVTGTILERAVEKGEFVTTGFVGERGAKGYVVSLADLNDLRGRARHQPERFRQAQPKQRGIVTTDAFPDRKYDGFIKEISPEANRQKATVQVKVKVVNPDDYLRPEMNASVASCRTRSRRRTPRRRPSP